MYNTLLIDRTDFDLVGDIAPECDKDRLSRYIFDAQNTILKNWLCEPFLNEILNNYCNDVYRDLLEGSEYEDCNGKKRRHHGLKLVLANLTYGFYLLDQSVKVTQAGAVQKITSDSVPIDLSQIKDIKNQKIETAKYLFQEVKNYIRHNRDLFENEHLCSFDIWCDCTLYDLTNGFECKNGCKGNCSCGTPLNSRSKKFKTLRKY